MVKGIIIRVVLIQYDWSTYTKKLQRQREDCAMHREMMTFYKSRRKTLESTNLLTPVSQTLRFQDY